MVACSTRKRLRTKAKNQSILASKRKRYVCNPIFGVDGFKVEAIPGV